MPPSTKLLITLLLILTAALLLVTTITTAADTLTVDDSGGEDYTTIQAAIDNAKEGDTILVYEGTYHENVVVNKTLTLIGNGSEKTTIDGGGDGDVVRIEADWCNMSGFRVTGSGDWKVAGINVKSNHNRIADNNCSGNEWAGIYLSGAFGSSYNNITETSCNSNTEYGIYLYHFSQQNIIRDVSCDSNNYGVFVFV